MVSRSAIVAAAAAAAALLLAAGACTTKRVVILEPERTAGPPTPTPASNTAVTLGIPPGHLPPVGRCRVWVPGVPPGRQARARSCSGILSGAPAGSWVVYRPSRDRRFVHVRLVHDRRPGVVTIVRIFEVEGRFVRDVRPEDEPDDDDDDGGAQR